MKIIILLMLLVLLVGCVREPQEIQLTIEFELTEDGMLDAQKVIVTEKDRELYERIPENTSNGTT